MRFWCPLWPKTSPFFIVNTPKRQFNFMFYFTLKKKKSRVVEIAGKSNASTIIFGAVYFLSAGNSDFLQNYYIDPLLQAVYSFDGFSHILMQSYTNFIQVPPDLLTAQSPFCFFFFLK
jgi:hypothetical protein